MNICIIGLGYVGLTLAVDLAQKGHSVHGVELSLEIIEALKNKRAHFYEKNFNDKLNAVLENGTLTFGENFIDTHGPVAYIVTVGTPLDTDGKINYCSINTVSNTLAHRIKNNDIAIIRSTVKIGTTRSIVKRMLDDANVDYHLGYCPERTLEGNALEELSQLPQIISATNKKSLQIINSLFSTFCAEVIEMNSIEEAEMVKLINNSERDLKFAFANEIALMCDTKGFNATDIIDAANYKYPRSTIAKPGPVGGPCLEKDPHILTESFINENYTPRLLKQSRYINENAMTISLNRMFDIINKSSNNPLEKVAILGFAFKGTPPTGDMRGSLVFSIIDTIKSHYPSASLFGHDYLACSQEMAKLGAKTFKAKTSIEDDFGIETQDEYCSTSNINPTNNILNITGKNVADDDDYNPGF